MTHEYTVEVEFEQAPQSPRPKRSLVAYRADAASMMRLSPASGSSTPTSGQREQSLASVASRSYHIVGDDMNGYCSLTLGCLEEAWHHVPLSPTTRVIPPQRQTTPPSSRSSASNDIRKATI